MQTIASSPLRFVCLLTMVAAASLAQANLVRNGDFETIVEDGPDGWGRNDRVTIKEKDGNHWLHVDRTSAGQKVKLPPDAWEIHLTMRMRATGVVVGKESWQNARLAMSFHDAKNERVGAWPNVFNATGSTDWVECDRRYRVPTNADNLSISASVFGPKGTAEFDDIKIVVTRLRSKVKNDEPLPEGVTNVWRMADAWRVKTPTRERICLNGLWQFRPVAEPKEAEAVPKVNDCWGWFPVPGIWTSQTTPELSVQPLVLSPWLEERIDLRKLDQAWCKRTFTLPAAWNGRRIWLDATMVQTHATVFVDDTRAGEIWFPGGRLDLTEHIRPGREQTLAVLVTARPVEKESHVFMAPDRIITNKATLKLKGLTGDIYLVSEPAAEAVDGVHVITSYRQKRIDFAVELRDPGAGQRRLVAEIKGQGRVVKTIASPLLSPAARLTFGDAWRDPRLWDTDTPANTYTVTVSLFDERDRLLDEFETIRFGFREFWIEGRDFLLNGSPIHLRALHNTTINSRADKSSLSGALRTMERMQKYGFNFLITGNYNFSPGEVGYIDGLLTAADRTGMLMSFSLPHTKDFNMKLDDPEQQARYEALTRWLIRRARNHPAVVLYAMNHNSTGYYGDQNPLKMDGRYQPEDHTDTLEYKGNPYRARARRQGTLAADIAKSLDPTRPVYHHQSGNLGDLHTVNIYLNWAPLQERDDWLSHWEANGAKPMFFVEWGLPHVSSWSSYRGPQFIWRNPAFQSVWDSEFAATYLGERAYEMTEPKRLSLAYEEGLWSQGKPFYWSSLIRHLRSTEECHMEIKSLFANSNWRAHRTRGVSAMLPWDQGDFWQQTGRPETETLDWQGRNLQQPGIVAALDTPGSQYIRDCGEESKWEPSSVGRAFLRWNLPLCAFIGGGPDAFTDKSHNALPGETLRKHLVVLNDTRRTRQCMAKWTSPFGLGTKTVSVEPGRRAFVPIRLRVAKDAKPGENQLKATFTFDDGTTQTDTFTFHVLPSPTKPASRDRIALLDPVGDTAKLLRSVGLRYRTVKAADSLAGVDFLVFGRGALAESGALPDMARIRDGLKVLVFEQDATTLRDRLGFRVNVQGLRRVFPRLPSHPVFAGVAPQNLRDWRGDATLVPPFLSDLPAVENHNPKWNWSGFDNTRVWRCGNRGSVASVLIEKPARGNWTALADGGFDLQYAPLLEGVFGKGRILFCQLDLTGRSEADPAAEQLCRNLVSYLQTAPVPASQAVAVMGDEPTRALAQSLGAGTADTAQLLLVGPGADLAKAKTQIENGASALALGLSADDLAKFGITAEKTAGYSSRAVLTAPEFAGLSDADLHWRTKLDYAAITTGDVGNDALRVMPLGNGKIVLCQVAPWMLDDAAKPYLRTSKRRNLCLVSRLLANLGATLDSPLPELLATPATPSTLDLQDGWRGLVDRDDQGRDGKWFQPDFDDAAWQPVKVGTTFESQRPELAEFDGVFWYRLRFRVPESLRQDQEITLHLGAIDDESTIWLNGRLLGEVNPKTNPKDYWSFPREYRLKPDQLKADENVVAVRVVDTHQTGGIIGKPRLSTPPIWLRSHYIQIPQAVDDPYRYYRW
jgi:beta-galactosidase